MLIAKEYCAYTVQTQLLTHTVSAARQQKLRHNIKEDVMT